MKIELELIPFGVPRFITTKRPPGTRQEGIAFDKSNNFALSELSEETLATLCDKFREDVFAEAKKKDPARKEEPDGR